jgi:hypothetical protein
VVGVFTHRSLARGLRHIRPQNNLLTAPVDDLVEELHFVRASQEVGDVLDFLAAIKVQRGVVGHRWRLGPAANDALCGFVDSGLPMTARARWIASAAPPRGTAVISCR